MRENTSRGVMVHQSLADRDVIGYLILNESGAIIHSEGELQNDEETANKALALIKSLAPQTVSAGCQPILDIPGGVENITVDFGARGTFVLWVSEKKLHVAKQRGRSSAPASPQRA